ARQKALKSGLFIGKSLGTNSVTLRLTGLTASPCIGKQLQCRLSAISLLRTNTRGRPVILCLRNPLKACRFWTLLRRCRVSFAPASRARDTVPPRMSVEESGRADPGFADLNMSLFNGTELSCFFWVSSHASSLYWGIAARTVFVSGCQ